MNMVEFKEQVKKDSVVILPVGALEGHGAHLPLSTDTLQPMLIAEAVSKRTGAFIAPPINYGNCSSTRNLPGTISISPDILTQLIKELLSELFRNGFRNAVILSGHAGSIHMASIKRAAEESVALLDMNIMVLSDYDLAYDLPDHPVREGDGHAGQIETSRVMAIRPDLVGTTSKDCKGHPPRFMILRNPEKHFPDGIMGYPSLASLELGKAMNDQIVTELTRLINEMVK